MKLTDLAPRWLSNGGEEITKLDGSPIPFRDRVGVAFSCPCGACGKDCYILFQNPPDGGPCCDATQRHWQRSGDTFETLSLTPSILRKDGCCWHGYITNGEAITC